MLEILSAYNVELFNVGFVSFRVFDLIDTGLVAFACYKLYSSIADSVAGQILSGVFVIIVALVLTSILNLSSLVWIGGEITEFWILVVILIFQPEIRRILIYLGNYKFFASLASSTSVETSKEVLSGLEVLKKNGTGALIVIVKNTGLKLYIETGVRVESNVKAEILVSIFHKASPLHDGAVIINDNQIKAAKCVFPLTSNKAVVYAYGTRHRAAVGITEVSDAIALVLSEETGRLSIAENGRLSEGLTFSEINKKLIYGLGRRKLSFLKSRAK